MSHWLGLSAAAFTAAAMQAAGVTTISVARMEPWVVTIGLLVVSFAGLMEWRHATGRAEDKSGACDAPYCTEPATLPVSDEHAFCARHAADFYDVAVDGGAK